MYSVYVLRSLRNGKQYVGWTRKTVVERLQRHQRGSTPWTKQNGPFEVVYAEHYLDAAEARRRERYLKGGHGREFLNSLLPR